MLARVCIERARRARAPAWHLCGSAAYYKTLAALRNLTAAPRVAALLASLPYGDERSTADDAKIVEGLVGMVLP